MKLRAWGVIAGMASLLACGDIQTSDRPANTRVVRLRLVPQDASQDALGGTPSVQLAAVRIERGQIVDIRTGTAEDPRAIRTLSVSLPTEQSFVVLLQSPGGNPGTLGRLVGRLRWSSGYGPTTDRLVAARVDVDLGEVSVVAGDPSLVSDNILQVTDAANPLALTDRDGDSESDLVDTDDDNDGDPDTSDPDVDGDALDDLGQELGSLPDDDADGVPDTLE